MPLRRKLKNFLRRLTGRPPKSSPSSGTGTPVNGTPPTSTKPTPSKPPVVLSQPRDVRTVTP
ncbi:hypothetical protein EX30DRAFT_344415 [Ascodesmis nigricans]|uniref:Uncharacterized protein n=1 Tax=Ascodesmis nigricans TaxID=341454 RepID=A0A4S2MR30_9PEZI|nr:hypothetical protein EX30DRAFT_344415 [Ascodesmis nigricans]